MPLFFYGEQAYTGEVIWFQEKKNFGFVLMYAKQLDSKQEKQKLFVHGNDLNCKINEMRERTKVTFRLQYNEEKTGSRSQSAVDVNLVSGASTVGKHKKRKNSQRRELQPPEPQPSKNESKSKRKESKGKSSRPKDAALEKWAASWC